MVLVGQPRLKSGYEQAEHLNQHISFHSILRTAVFFEKADLDKHKTAYSSPQKDKVQLTICKCHYFCRANITHLMFIHTSF